MKTFLAISVTLLVGFCDAGCCGCVGKPQYGFVLVTPYALDLSKINADTVSTSSGKSGTVSYNVYSAQPGVKIASVSDGKTEIWKAKEGETCKTVSESTTLIPKILAICIGKDGEVNLECFEKVGEEWKSITEKEFTNRIKGTTSKPHTI
ncbi:signal peptide-containing protein [Theileria equi strain WA]|uniref:Signal peptide-containing protein n=1 Tax=Theileria equi strain WA TaxID=1537102 RepID=L0AX34_THEEQ|nr:signal peptide-containing protein [Theileria equi strain WA]AFZ79813.1 signal peptide-containing protein [Theileria equi strain WA]|eukprot:XP_004829479.1 signal peptide-containing protein [Theileria equi strain WA]